MQKPLPCIQEQNRLSGGEGEGEGLGGHMGVTLLGNERATQGG